MRLRVVVLAFATAIAMGCGLVLGLEDHDYVAAVPDTGVDAPEIVDPPSDGCVAPSCEGRCGNLVAACTLGAVCGKCATGQTCDDDQTCQCARECDASCGEVVDSCGKTVTCGTCEGGSSCQTDDAGALACRDGVCAPPDAATTCADKRCGFVTNTCGKPIDCGGCPGEICFAKTCGCPPREIALDLYKNGNANHCIAAVGVPEGACPSGFDRQKTIGRIYASAGPLPLFRCRTTTNNFYLTHDQGCEGIGGATKVKIGYSADNACGSAALRRYKNALGDVYESFDDNPPNGYTFKSANVRAWRQ